LLWLGNFKTSGCLVGRPTCAPATTRLTPQLVGTSAITYNLSPYIRDYLTKIGPPAIIIEVYSRNENDGTQFSNFHCKRIGLLLNNGEVVGRGVPRLDGARDIKQVWRPLRTNVLC